MAPASHIGKNTRAMTDRVCIIGAGSSGVVAAKVLRERGVPFDCFELGSQVGGLWRYENDTGRSPAYASLQTNTSRDRTGYACFPMPEGDSPYPHNSELADYFDAFTDHFGLADSITFRTQVVRVSPVGEEDDREGPYDVAVRSLRTGETEVRRYGAVLIASGHHWDPSWPWFPGSRGEKSAGRPGHFNGLEMHSHAYRSPERPVRLEGRRVLVVGIGNSACDIACEAAGVAARTVLSTRRGAHVLPKYLFGRPLDHWITPLTSRLPIRAQTALIGALVRLAYGDQARLGVPRPRHRLGQEHPTISQDLTRLAGEGRIVVKPNVERLAGDEVHFVDGTQETVGVVIYATGYRVSFPFLDEGFLPALEAGGVATDNRLPLYLHVVPPERGGVYFLGLIQPLGAIPPLAEAQAEWVADLVQVIARPPSPDQMRAAIDGSERCLRSRFVESSRHTMEVDYHPYLRAIRRARAEGARRAGLKPARFEPPSGTAAR
jgi:thioredoxin reductase